MRECLVLLLVSVGRARPVAPSRVETLSVFNVCPQSPNVSLKLEISNIYRVSSYNLVLRGLLIYGKGLLPKNVESKRKH